MDDDRYLKTSRSGYGDTYDRRDYAIMLLLLAVVLAAKWPVLHVPYHWDEMGAYFAPAHWLSERSLLDVLPGRHPEGMFFGHPPLLYLLTAGLFKFFGPLPIVAHAISIGFASLGVLFVYRLGRVLVSREVAIGAAVLLLAFPLYFAQSGMLLGDVPIAALAVTAVFYRYDQRPFVYAMIATAMVMIKESAVLLVLVLLCADLISATRTRNNRSQLAFHFLPLLALAGFFVLQKGVGGTFLPNPYFKQESLLVFEPAKVLWKGAFAAYWAFFAQWRFLLTGAIVLAAWRLRKQVPSFFLLFSLISCAYVFAFTFIYFLPRYMLIVAPFHCLMASTALHHLCRDRYRFGLAVAVPLFLALMMPPLKKSGYDSFETTMQYLDVITISREVASTLSRDFQGQTVLAPWPLAYLLAEPRYGYVREKLPVTMDSNAPWDLVAITPHGDQATVHALRALISSQSLEKLRRIALNGKEIEIYRRTGDSLSGKGTAR